MGPPDEAFLARSSKDQTDVAELAKVLQRHGIQFWYSRTSIRGAQQWHDEIGAALRRCDWFVLLLSPAAVESRWVKRELLFALDQPSFENRILPLLYADCDLERLSWVLPSLEAIDFRTDREAGYRELLRTWSVDYRSP